jgi:prepilin signal peptidase PulO-like enzyme (type II secretory pathway)
MSILSRARNAEFGVSGGCHWKGGLTMAWYVIVLIVSSGLFLLTTIISLFFGDMDIGTDTDVGIDMGVDAGSGFLVSDVISFKGLIHFAIGFSLALTLMGGFTLSSVVVGVITGIIFVLVLYYLYKFIFDKFQQSMKYTTEINNMDAEVYFWDNKSKIGEVFITLEGRPVTVALKCSEDVHFEKGQKIRVSGTRNSVCPHKIEATSANSKIKACD